MVSPSPVAQKSDPPIVVYHREGDYAVIDVTRVPQGAPRGSYDDAFESDPALWAKKHGPPSVTYSTGPRGIASTPWARGPCQHGYFWNCPYPHPVKQWCWVRYADIQHLHHVLDPVPTAPRPVKVSSDWNGTCPRCGANTYQGAWKLDHDGPCNPKSG